MTGICGWLGSSGDDASVVIGAMRQRITWAGPPAERSITGPGFGLAAVGPADTIGVFEFGPLRMAIHGHGLWRDKESRVLSPADLCDRFANAYRDRGIDALSSLRGDFSVAVVDLEQQQLVLAIDRMGVRNLVYRQASDALVFAANLDSLAAHPSVTQRIDPQAIYNYIYFHMVPGPDTIFERTRRLLPGHYVLAKPDHLVVRSYWEMRFDESRFGDGPSLASDFRKTLAQGVKAVSSGTACGTFLSGGTDSSTVTGVLSGLKTEPVDTFSIGFDASGYDEMSYARLAAQHFRTTQHEYYVTPSDVVDALPRIASEYDQPFGNASAVPTYYCAKLAHDRGIMRLLAGDGGDELFGGNVRYARQHMLALYERIPRALRGVIEPIAGTAFAKTTPLLRKVASYVEQARQPMPARYESYNLLNRLGPENVFDPGFLESVDRGQPLAQLSQAYHAAHAGSLINRMLALDLKYTLADNDLPKVTRMCDQAGVDVAFPLLNDDVVDFSANLAPSLKLRGRRLRYFFKEALREFLPEQIIKKQKHGFGLPAGPWLADHAPLHAMSRDALKSLGERGIFQRRFLDDLVDVRLHQHSAYFGTMVWILMMLELWFVHHAKGR